MTKLVSKNPVLRFKEGRKIVKAYEGSIFERTAKNFNGVRTNKNGHRYYTAGNHNYFENGEIWDVRTGKKIGTSDAIAKEYIHPLWTPELIKADRAAKGIKDTTVTAEQAEKSNKTNQGKVTVNSNNPNTKKVDTHYIGTKGNTNLYTRSAEHAGVTNRDQVRALQRELGIKDDGIWGNETQKAWASRNGLQFNSPGIGTGVKEYNTGILNEDGSFTPNGSTYQNPREAVKSTVAELNPSTPEYMDEPGRFSIGTALNSGNVRSNRNLYRNVDEYYNWLNTDAGANSDDYKLFANTGLWAPNISEENRRAAFDEMMNQYGISGNLGRRDSGRLANLLNNLSSLGNNSDMRGAFVDAYNNALDKGIASRTGSDGTVYSNSRVRDLFDKIVVNPAIRYGSSVLSWLSTPSNVSNASLGIKTPGNADYGTLLKYKFMPNRFNFYRNGGLIPKDPVDLFKIRKGASGFKVAFDKARAAGNRYFFYQGKTFNTMTSSESKTAEGRASWAKKFKDNLTSGGASNVQTSINRGWSGKGASHGRYNSKGEYVKFEKASDAGPLALKGDHINDNGNKGWGYADMPEEAVNLGRGTNRGQHTGNIKTNVEIGDYTQEYNLPEVSVTAKRRPVNQDNGIYYNVPMGAIEYTGRDGKRYWMTLKHGSTNLYVYISRDKPISYATQPVPEGYIIPGLNVPITKDVNIGKIALNMKKKYLKQGGNLKFKFSDKG